MSKILNSTAITPVYPSPDVLQRSLQAVFLHQPKGFASIEWVDSTGSTNADLIARIKDLQSGSQSGDLTAQTVLPCLRGAHFQTAGKGRTGRTWVGTEGATLMFSCAFPAKIPLAQLAGLSPAIGIATCEALRGLVGNIQPDISDRLTLKWPNDILWNKSKLAGILVESTGRNSSTGETFLVIGIGLNLQAGQALSTQLDREITDWSEIMQAINRLDTFDDTLSLATSLITALTACWADTLAEYALNGFNNYVERFNRVDALANSPVYLSDHGQILNTGIAQGVDATGRLLLKTETGIVPVLVGDISVRRTPLPGNQTL